MVAEQHSLRLAVLLVLLCSISLPVAVPSLIEHRYGMAMNIAVCLDQALQHRASIQAAELDITLSALAQHLSGGVSGGAVQLRNPFRACAQGRWPPSSSQCKRPLASPATRSWWLGTQARAVMWLSATKSTRGAPSGIRGSHRRMV